MRPGCLFGWACAVFPEEADVVYAAKHNGNLCGLAYRAGAAALGLPVPKDALGWMETYWHRICDADRLSARLFFVGRWPEKFQDIYGFEMQRQHDKNDRPQLSKAAS